MTEAAAQQQPEPMPYRELVMASLSDREHGALAAPAANPPRPGVRSAHCWKKTLHCPEDTGQESLMMMPLG